MLALVLAFAIATAPCDKTDNSCLLKLTLQQTYALEASQQENAILQHRLEDAQRRVDNGGKFFVVGMLAGVVFVGLGATIAMKVIK